LFGSITGIVVRGLWIGIGFALLWDVNVYQFKAIGYILVARGWQNITGFSFIHFWAWNLHSDIYITATRKRLRFVIGQWYLDADRVRIIGRLGINFVSHWEQGCCIAKLPWLKVAPD
jgi:hypothetical protein